MRRLLLLVGTVGSGIVGGGAFIYAPAAAIHAGGGALCGVSGGVTCSGSCAGAFWQRHRRLWSDSRARSWLGSSGESRADDGDDQRVFWDTAVEVLEKELGDGADMSRVWEFVAHNRDGKPPPPSPRYYRATGLYFPGLEATPWWDRSEFSWLQELEDAADEITREMDALQSAGKGRGYQGGTGEMSAAYDATKGWGTMRIRYMGRYEQPGVNYALLPRTLSSLRRLPLAPETAAFQRQLPGTGLPMHVDPSNFVLGCHLGLVVPPAAGATTSSSPGGEVERGRRGSKSRKGKATGRSSSSSSSSSSSAGIGFGGGASPGESGGRGGQGFASAFPPAGEGRGRGSSRQVDRATSAAATKHGERQTATSNPAVESPGEGGGETAWIEVAEEKRSWEAGRAFVFDPSFLHRTHNPTLGERVILNVDIWHPGLEKAEIVAIQTVCELVEQWNARSGLFELTGS